MTNPRMQDHAVGLELELVELVERKERAEIQGRSDEQRALDRQIETVQAELATTAEVASAEPAPEVGDRKPRVDAPIATDVA